MSYGALDPAMPHQRSCNFCLFLKIFADHVLHRYRFVPTYFEKDISSGMPVLTAEGLKAIEEEMKTSDGAP